MSHSTKEIPPRSIHEHCWYLSTGLSQAPIEHDLHNASDWLHIASSIQKVDLDLSRFDESITVCETPYEYARDRTALLTQLVSELTMFNYIWGSLEAVI